jgi:N-acetyl-anhydromuramyl-L-alanine amidase AmpD
MPILQLSPVPSEPSASELSARETAWLDAIREHRYSAQWHRVGSVEWSTAIKVDGVRICLSYRSALEAARIMGARLPTKAEADAMFRAARHVPPVLVRPVSASLAAIEAHSREVDRLATDCELIDNHGKIWLAGAPSGRALNYGWVDAPSSGAKMRANGLHLWQDVGAAHTDGHVDYSQTLRVVRDVSPQSPGNGPPKPPPSGPSQPTPTKPGDRGPAVTAWQRHLLTHGYELPRFGADGDHGAETERATEAWRDDHDETPTRPDLVVPTVKFRQSGDYTKGRPFGPPRWVVIHTAECAETSDAAENLQSWTASGAANVSWHYAIDNDSITQSVKEEDIAWAAGPANDHGIHIELAGTAFQTAAQWSDAYSLAQLDLLAPLVAGICARWRIPPQRLTPEDMLAGKPGICGHDDVTAACRLARQRGHKVAPWWTPQKGWRGTDHGDPGKAFPWGDVMAAVQRLS